jgi:type I restriction enzyme S subunit
VFSYEATLNRYAMIPKGFRGCLGRRMALIRPDESKACGRFLYYYFFGQEWRNVIAQNTLIGSTVDRIPIAKFPDFPITVPPLPTQRKIAVILSAYDDLIENNLRRIKILEEMAQNLYREWFVKFRFPGHQHARFIDSPLGRIPEGWEVRNLLSVADITYGFAFQSKQFNSDGNGKPVVRIRDVMAGTSDTFSPEEAGKKYLIENGDILVGMDGDFHMGFWVGGQAYLVQRVARFRPKGEIGRYHLFLTLQEPIQHFNVTITGTTVAHLGDKHIKTIEIKWPQGQLINRFNSLLEPMLAEILNLRIKNVTLRRTRDLLLPKLISGEVDVSELDIAVSGESGA